MVVGDLLLPLTKDLSQDRAALHRQGHDESRQRMDCVQLAPAFRELFCGSLPSSECQDYSGSKLRTVHTLRAIPWQRDCFLHKGTARTTS